MENMYDYIESSRDHHLTIADVEKLHVGDSLDVVMWDANWEESWAWNDAHDMKPYDAQEFYRPNRVTVTYVGGREWDIDFPHGEIFRHPFHLDVSSLQTYWTWSGLGEDDSVHITYEMLPSDIGKIPKGWKEKHVPWDNFPKTTRVGWRGPMMLWKHLENAPQIYHKEEYFGSKTSKYMCD